MRLLQVLAAVCAVGGFALAPILARSPEHVVGIALIELIAIAFGAAAVVAKSRATSAAIRSEANQPLLPYQPPSEDVINERVKEMSAAEAELGVAMILDPQSYFQRISESATPAPGEITVRGTYGLQAPFASPHVFVPLIMTRRGSLLNFLSVTGGDGKRIGTLALDEEAVYLAALFRRLVASSTSPARLRAYVRDVEPRIADLVCSQRPVPESDVEALSTDFAAIQQGARRHAPLVLAVLLIRELSERTPLLVAMPEAEHRPKPAPLRVRYGSERRLALRQSDDAETTGVRWAVGLLVRLALGVHPNTIVVSLENADRAQSYHVQVAAPSEHLYLGGQSGASSMMTREPRRGQAFSHAYARGGHGFANELWRSSFYEVPPGSTGTAAVAALAVLFGLGLLAWSQLRWSDASGSVSATLLFALPGVATAFFGFSQSSGFLRRSVRARASSIVSLGLAVVAVCFGVAHTRSVSHSTDLMAKDITELTPLLVAWLFLIGMQLVHTVYIWAVFVHRTYVYWVARVQ